LPVAEHFGTGSKPQAFESNRRAVGTAVFGGMIAASSIGIFLVPMLYTTFQRLRERLKAKS
jgi:multidrug efflux pump subunit AcrB